MQSGRSEGIQMEDIEELCSKFLDIHLGWKEVGRSSFLNFSKMQLLYSAKCFPKERHVNILAAET